MKKRILPLALILLFIFVASCRKTKDEEPTISTEVLVDYKQVYTQSKELSKSYISLSGISLPATEIKYDITTYSVTYNTTYQGKKIKASGLITLPTTTDAIGLLSIQHGTITTFEEAPSALTLFIDRAFQLYTLEASFGFMVAAPDYIGFGESKQYRHPYYVDEATSSAVIDLLKAAKELAAVKKVNFNKKLFLAGYSQGGYATLSTHRAIENKPLDGIDLIASFPAAGGYDLIGMQKIVFGLKTYSQPSFLGYVLVSYKNHYNLNDLYAAVVKSPYAEKIDGLYDGTHSTDAINQELTTSVADLLTADALTSFATNAKFSSFREALKNNSLIDWKPTKTIYFYHGDADTTVPCQTTVDTFSSLIKAGASTDLVKFYTIKGADHSTAVYTYIQKMMEEVLKLK